MQAVYDVEYTNNKIVDFVNDFTNQITSDKNDFYRVAPDKFAYFTSHEIDIEESIKKIKNFLQDLEFDTVIGACQSNDKLIISANMALNFALEHGLDSKIFSEDIDLTDQYKQELLFKSIINKAIQEDLVFPVFQPIFNKDKELLKYEILMRMSSIDEEGEEHIYYPSQFLKFSYLCNKFNDISTILIKKAFKKMSQSSKKFSINLSYDDISNKYLTDLVEEQIQLYANIGERLILEILETHFIEDYDLINEFILRFKKYGVQIALDDFGSGYSNLNHIINFQSDYVKLDGALIKNLQSDEKSMAIVKSVVFFTKELGIKTIAEYVATKEIFEIAKSLDIDEYQGFYLSKPLREINE